MYSGFGNDLLNADDDHSTNTLRNDVPDTQVSYEDRAYGGAGRDVLIGNTGGDRLIDWVGEFNSYLVPFAPFGMATVSRTLQPQLAEFLYTLSASDGADPTRFADTGALADQAFRHGEPEGELGVIRQKDYAWQDQTGAPTDPQAGNIPGGHRDVLRSANFNTNTPEAMFIDSGTFKVQSGRLTVSSTQLGGDAAAVWDIGAVVPTYFEIRATVSVVKPVAGKKANAYIIFDYQSATDFKFAGLDSSSNKIVMGQRTSAGWQVLVQTPMLVKHSTDFNLLLAINGTTATLVVNNSNVFSYAFTPRVVEDYTFALNNGYIGIGSDNSAGTFDNMAVQVLPANIVLTRTDGFDDTIDDVQFATSAGNWTVGGSQLTGTPSDPNDTVLKAVDLRVGTNFVYQLQTKVSTSSLAGIVFDYYSPTDYKFAAINVQTKQIVIGHVGRGGMTIDASVSRTSLAATGSYTLDVSLKGTTVSVSIDGATALGFVFNGPLVDGQAGIFAKSTVARFDSYELRTDDGDAGANAPAPNAANDSFSVGEDSQLTITAAQLLANDSDPSGLVLAVMSVTQPANGTLTAVAGGWAFTPAANFNGTTGFTYTISNGQGGTATGVVTITVTPVNDAPVANNDSVSATQDTPKTITAASLLANDTDVDLDMLTITGVSTPSSGTLTPAAGGWIYTPLAGFFGTATFTYTVSDGNGGAATGTVTISIAKLNHVPVANADAVATAEDTPVAITRTQLTSNDSDPDGDPLTISGVGSVANGTLTANANGWTFTPNANWHGTTSFTYSVSDGKGGTASATVTITVSPVNDAPIAATNAFSTNQDSALSIPYASVLANDSDVDGDALSFAGFSQPANGTLVAGETGWTYTPNTGFHGADSFTYTISDGNGGTASATVTITVVKVNRAPVAGNDSVSTNEDTPVSITRAFLTGNDSDPDNDSLSITAVSSVANGTLTVNGTTGWTFTPTTNWSGTTSFTYTLSDGTVTTTGTVTITVAPVNDNPVATNKVFSTNQGVPLNITNAQLLAGATDVDGDTLSILSVAQPANGTLTAIAGGWTFTPAAGFNGSTSFTFAVSDGKGGTATATANITVNPASTSKTYYGTGGAIADFTTTTFNLNVADSHTLLSVGVQASITHQRIADLTVTLISPDGTRVQVAVNSNGTISASVSQFAGKQLAGVWKLEIKDARKKMDGTLNSWSITATWGSAQMTFSTASIADAFAVTSDDVDALARSALDLWAASGAVSADQFAWLQSVEFEVVDLPGAMLGWATWGKILIDVNAAGFGWFVDSTSSAGGSGAFSGMDLLSVLGHELGHQLGHDHGDGMMIDTLGAGIRTFSSLGFDRDHEGDHAHLTATGDAFPISDISSALRRLDTLSFDGWMSGSTSSLSGFSLNTAHSIFESFAPMSFGLGRASGFSIFDEEGDELLG